MSILARLHELEDLARACSDGIEWGEMQVLADLYATVHGDTRAAQSRRRRALKRDVWGEGA